MDSLFSVPYVSLLMIGIAVIAVFNYIPLISEFAFWVALAAYILLWGYRPAAK